MMTKEEILNKRDLIFYYSLTPEAVEGTKEDVFAAMDEYAQQVAIGFHEWRKNRYQETHIGYYEPKVGTDEFKVYNYTIEQLFNQYIQSIK
jgi:hypothetical protein